MKKITILLLLTALAALSQSNKSADPGGQAVRAAEQAWADATTKGDEAALKRVLADDLTYTHSNAEIDTKRVFIDNLKTKTRTYHKVDYGKIDVRVFGRAAILEATAHFDVTTRGQRSVAHLRIIHVWVNSGGNWQLAAHQSTRIQ